MALAELSDSVFKHRNSYLCHLESLRRVVSSTKSLTRDRCALALKAWRLGGSPDSSPLKPAEREKGRWMLVGRFRYGFLLFFPHLHRPTAPNSIIFP